MNNLDFFEFERFSRMQFIFAKDVSIDEVKIGPCSDDLQRNRISGSTFGLQIF